jgi:hypothetical protein
MEVTERGPDRCSRPGLDQPGQRRPPADPVGNGGVLGGFQLFVDRLGDGVHLRF